MMRFTDSGPYSFRTEDPDFFGISTQVDLYGCNEYISSPEMITQYVVQLCELIQMRRFGDPTIVLFGDDPRVRGFTLTQLIETSLISAHFVEAHKEAYIDIFSCKQYEPYDVASFSKKFFAAGCTSAQYQIRRRSINNGQSTYCNVRGEL